MEQSNLYKSFDPGRLVSIDWIDVNEKLPTRDESFLVTLDVNGHPTTSILDYDVCANEWWCCEKDGCFNNVTAWHPLPTQIVYEENDSDFIWMYGKVKPKYPFLRYAAEHYSLEGPHIIAGSRFREEMDKWMYLPLAYNAKKTSALKWEFADEAVNCFFNKYAGDDWNEELSTVCNEEYFSDSKFITITRPFHTKIEKSDLVIRL